MCVYYYIYTHIYYFTCIYTHTCMSVCRYICIHTHIYTLTRYVCGRSHTPETQGVIPFEMQGLCFHPKPDPYHIIAVVFFSLQCSVLSSSSWMGGCASSCLETPWGMWAWGMWGERPALMVESSWGRRARRGAAGCGRWEDRWWGILQEFLIAATSLVVGLCPSAVGSLSCCTLRTAIFRLGTRFTVENKPPASVFHHIYFEDK